MSAFPPDNTPDDTPDLKRRAGLARLGALWAAAAVAPLAACGGSGDDSPAPAPLPGTPPPPGGPSSGGGTPPPPPAPPPPPSAGTVKTTVLNSSLEGPWGLAFLPDGRMLVTQKAGTMVILSADGKTKSGPLAGVPTVASTGQGGLLDVVLDPDFGVAGSNWVYFSYAEPLNGLSGTAVNRGRLDAANLQLLDVSMTPLFRQLPKVSGSTIQFGSRLVFRKDKTLMVTLGDRGQDALVQDPTTHIGKTVRINRDGSVPTTGTLNPNFGAGSKPELWSVGHRNPQGAAMNPTTDELWVSEHGPQGGDEINRVQPGLNYGWPVISYGQQYGTTTQYGEGTAKDGMQQPVTYWEKIDGSAWTPGTAKSSIAPCGISFYTGDKLTGWTGNLFVGALAGTALWRLTLSGNMVTARERLFASLGERIRCVRQGPDGWLYLLTDSGKLIRVEI